MAAEAEDKSASGGGPVLAENEQTARCECQTSDHQTSDQRREPVERGRPSFVAWMTTGVTALRASTASGTVRPSGRPVMTAGSDDAPGVKRSPRSSGRGVVELNVGAVRQETAVRSPGRAVCCRADACADGGDEHAENERNPEHVELLLFGPLGAADQETVVCSRRNEGNAGCKTAARAIKSLQISAL